MAYPPKPTLSNLALVELAVAKLFVFGANSLALPFLALLLSHQASHEMCWASFLAGQPCDGGDRVA